MAVTSRSDLSVLIVDDIFSPAVLALIWTTRKSPASQELVRHSCAAFDQSPRQARSDGGEFGARGCQPQVRAGVDGEFVVAAADVLDQGMSGADGLDRAQPFQVVHRP